MIQGPGPVDPSPPPPPGEGGGPSLRTPNTETTGTQLISTETQHRDNQDPTDINGDWQLGRRAWNSTFL